MLLTGKIWEFMAYLTLPVLYILIKRHIHIAVRTIPGFYQLHASSCYTNCKGSISGVIF